MNQPDRSFSGRAGKRAKEKFTGDAVGTWALRLLVLSLCVLGAVQGFLRFESFRRMLSPAVRLEGKPIEQDFPALNDKEPVWFPTYLGREGEGYDGVVVLRVESSSAAPVWVLVNGFPLKQMVTGPGAVWVKQGDIIGIHAPGETVKVTVSGVSENVSYPPLGYTVEGRGTFGLFRVGFGSPRNGAAGNGVTPEGQGRNR